MCAGSTKIAAPIVILKIAAASPRMPMTRRSAGAWVGGAGDGEAMHQGMEKQVLRYARVPRAPLRMTTLRACLQKWVRMKKKPVLGQIFAGGVTIFDQADLPQPFPALDLLLARNGVSDVRKLLEVDEPGDAILAGEPRDEASFVLVHSPRQVIRYPGIEHP